jgi:hypothetical protein
MSVPEPPECYLNASDHAQTSDAVSSDNELSESPAALSPSSPYLWPETRILNRSRHYSVLPVFEPLISQARSIFGFVHNLTSDGIRWIDERLAKNERLQFTLIVALYPACRTTSDNLRMLRERCEAPCSRLRVRLKILNRTEDRPTTNLSIVSENGSATMVVSPSGDFALREAPDGFLHLCFPADTALHQQFMAWFEYQWVSNAILDAQALTMPDLVPAEGDPLAGEQWDGFQHQLNYGSQMTTKQDEAGVVNVDPETGDVISADENGKSTPSVLDEANVPRPSIALVQMGKVLHQGNMATIDNSSRVPPLDCPVSAELFNIPQDQRTGTILQRTRFSVSAIDEKTLNKLEAFRKRTRELLNKMSYPLADGNRFVPLAARPLLEAELDRVNKEGQELLGSAVVGTAEAFVKSKEKQVAKDAQQRYAELHDGEKMPDDTLRRILEELTARLTRAKDGKILSELNFLDVRIATAEDSDWSNKASQALRFLIGVVKYPRECLTDPYFMRGIKVPVDKLLPAMDVMGDQLVSTFLEHGTGVDQAREQLGWIEAIQRSLCEDMAKCEAIYRLIKGRNKDEIEQPLTGG